MGNPTVSIGMSVWNGEAFLSETLDSLLAQDYADIEIIILDNLSEDRTAEICKDYSRRDPRVRYILDDRKRNVMEGQRKASEFARGEFFMLVCDDDVYAPGYISSMLRLLKDDPSAGMAYSGYDFICPDGAKKPSGWKIFFSPGNSEFFNFAYYLFFRAPIPLIFGVTRIDVHRDALDYYYRPDHRGWNHDNLYMLRLLSRTRVASDPAPLFFYRHRDRPALYKKRKQYDLPVSGFAHFWNFMLHQSSVTRAIWRIIGASPFGPAQGAVLRLYSALIFLYNCGPRYISYLLHKED